MMYIFCYYFLLFFIYSVFGWMIESIACSIIDHKPVLNRGFLIGPYIPIYGTAAILMTLFLTEYKKDPFVLFSMAVVYASLLEYATSYFMEKIFAARWWNYEHEKFNLNGRICLKNSLLFGVLGFFLIHISNPCIMYGLDQIPQKVLIITSWIFFIIFVLDFLVTLWILSKLKIRTKKIQGDATKEIDRESKQFLKNYRFLYKRLLRAFPKVHFPTEKGNAFIDKIRKRFDEADQFLMEKKQEIEKIKQRIKELKEKSESKNVLKEQKQKLKEIRKRKFK